MSQSSADNNLDTSRRLAKFLGFEDRASVLLWIVLAPITCLVAAARSPLLTTWGMQAFGAPGESFRLRDVRVIFIIHLAFIIPWCFIGVLQFVPSIRKSLSFQYHRLAGRIFLFLSVVVAISGLALVTKAFGGTFDGQIGMFTLTVAFLIAAFNGYWSILSKNIPAHRDWMLRLFAYGTSVITLRVFMFIGLQLSPVLGLYTTSKCDVIAALIGDAQTLHTFSGCGGNETVDGSKVVIIQGGFASMANVMAGLQIGFQGGVLLALLVHAALVEIRYGFVRDIIREESSI
eukprot:gene33902-45411_t